MKLKRGKKIILMIVMVAFMVLLLNSNTIFAAINGDYSGQDPVPDENLEEAFDESTLLDLLARLIYAVGRFLEWILGVIFQMLTGTSDFPWADKIVFNAVPLLDVNFINPDTQSFVFSIKDILKNLYATIMTLAVGFFGIAVLITAIKLVISTIASEKAKYKQAVVDWLVGFVMLFCIHYFIAFVFYLNEQLVQVASKIVTTQLDTSNGNIAQIQADTTAKKLIERIRASGATYRGRPVADLAEANIPTLLTWMNLDSSLGSTGIHTGMMMTDFANWLPEEHRTQFEQLGMVLYWASNSNVTTQDVIDVKNSIKVYRNTVYGTDNDCYNYCTKTQYRPIPTCSDECRITDKEHFNQAINTYEFAKLFKDNKGEFNYILYEQFLRALGVDTIYVATPDTRNSLVVNAVTKEDTLYEPQTIEDISMTGQKYYILSRGSSKFGNAYKSGTYIQDTTFYLTDLLDDMIRLKSTSSNTSGTGNSGDTGNSVGKVRLIADLASYFRYNSHSKELGVISATGVKNGENIEIQNMIMYSVLVAQSLILFIAYIKRLFYVVILAMMAPVVVVFDFFQKFGK